jgi:hypothetical protein
VNPIHSNSNEEINNRGNKGRNIIGSVNSILQDESLGKIKKVHKTNVQSVTIYGAEARDVNRKNSSELLATETDYQRKSCRRTRPGRIRNETIRKMMKMEKDITDEVQKRQLI